MAWLSPAGRVWSACDCAITTTELKMPTRDTTSYEAAFNLLQHARDFCAVEDKGETSQPWHSALGAGFNAVTLLRPNECDISRVIATLLDPRGSHGHGEIFLEEFLLMVRQVLPVKHWKAWMTSSQFRGVALEEMTIHGRRLDTVLRLGNGCLGIENKPWTGDQERQLSDYAEHLERKSPGNWLLLYLCNWEPSNSSLPPSEALERRSRGQFLRLDFAAVATWIMRCKELCRDPHLGYFLQDLNGYLRTAINNQTMAIHNSPISSLLESREQFETALAVAVAVAHVKAERVNQLHDQLLEELRPLHLQLYWDMGRWATKSAYFTISDGAGRAICFEWSREGLNDLCWGLWGDRPNPDEDNKKLTAVHGDGEMSPRWAWWQRWPSFFQSSQDANSDPATWRYLESGEFAKEVAARVRQSFDALSTP